MVSRNPSVQAGVEDELKYWKKEWKHCGGSKSAKEYILRQIHRCESLLGRDSKPYNGNSA